MPTSGANPTSFSKSSTSISSGRRKPFLFLSNLIWRRKKVLELDDIIFDRNQRTRSEPSVISYSCTAMTSQHPHEPHHNGHNHNKTGSTLTMTPGRCRDLDQDMHALRLSRQDNPFVQKVLASRESLIDTLDDTVSDDAILMASEELNGDECEDPFTLPEVKEHMIRSPPPTTWPRSPQYMFTYNQDNNLTISSQSSDDDCGYNNSQSVRAQDLFQRTTSVSGATSGRNGNFCSSNGGLNIALSRPKSTSVNMTGSALGESQLSISTDRSSAITTPGGSSMILRPQCLFDEGPGVRGFK